MKNLIAFFILLSAINVNANDPSSIQEDLVLEKNPVVIIWSHGKTRPQKSEKCSSRFNKIPKTLKYLEKEINAHFIFMCSKSTDNDNSPGSYIYKRVKQLKKLLTEINEIGVKPNNIFMGEKDFQQLFLVKNFIEKKYKSKIISCKTIRNNNKLALSSRNLLLKNDQLINAEKLSQNLISFKKKLNRVKNITKLLQNKKEQLNKIYNVNIEYLELRNMINLKNTNKIKYSKLFIAYYLDKVRLIDNF